MSAFLFSRLYEHRFNVSYAVKRGQAKSWHAVPAASAAQPGTEPSNRPSQQISSNISTSSVSDDELAPRNWSKRKRGATWMAEIDFCCVISHGLHYYCGSILDDGLRNCMKTEQVGEVAAVGVGAAAGAGLGAAYGVGVIGVAAAEAAAAAGSRRCGCWSISRSNNGNYCGGGRRRDCYGRGRNSGRRRGHSRHGCGHCDTPYCRLCCWRCSDSRRSRLGQLQAWAKAPEKVRTRRRLLAAVCTRSSDNDGFGDVLSFEHISERTSTWSPVSVWQVQDVVSAPRNYTKSNCGAHERITEPSLTGGHSRAFRRY
ncbi:hypothetical protein ALQ97_05516 [Pseudomonas savastanoi pv. glycinea]|nr:hypothetical protein ALQ97_05516 [Pseudomonas savastanoi pv. glycinea]